MAPHLRIPAADLSRRKVYLDRNAFSLIWRCKNLSERDLLRLRRRLSSVHFARRPNVVVSQWSFREMSSRLEHPQVERQIAAEVAFLTTLPSFLLLRAPLDVMRSEVQAALRGVPLDVFFDKGWEFPLDVGATWQDELKGLHADGHAFETSARDGMARVRQMFPDPGALAKGFSQELAENAELAVSNAARREMRRAWEKLGLPRNEALWPSPQALPSIWARAGFSVFFSQLSIRDRRNPKRTTFWTGVTTLRQHTWTSS